MHDRQLFYCTEQFILPGGKQIYLVPMSRINWSVLNFC